MPTWNEPEIRNAKIVSTMLGVEDHGILTCMLHLNYGGMGQGFGGYAFDEPIRYGNGRFVRREGVAFGMEFIRRVLEVTGVEKWESLPGTHIRVRASRETIEAIGHIIKDDWFTPKELADKMFPKETPR